LLVYHAPMLDMDEFRLYRAGSDCAVGSRSCL